MFRSLGLVGVVATAMAITSVRALECPQTAAVRITGLDDAADLKVAEDLRALMHGQLQLAAVIANVRSQAPGVDAAALSNYLIGEIPRVPEDDVPPHNEARIGRPFGSTPVYREIGRGRLSRTRVARNPEHERTRCAGPPFGLRSTRLPSRHWGVYCERR